MTDYQTFLAAEAAWIASQNAAHDFLDAGADERERLHAEYLKAFFAWMHESRPPTPVKMEGVVSDWNKETGRGLIQHEGGIVTFWKSGLTQAYIPGVGDKVTFRMGVSVSRGEVSEVAVGVTCTDLPAPSKTVAQIKARQEAQKHEDLIKSLAARREARQQKRVSS